MMELLPTLTHQRPSRRFTIPQPVRLPFLLGMLLASSTTFLSVTFYTQLQPVVPLFYSRSLPEQQIVSKELIFLLPALSVLIVIIHLIFARILAKNDQVMMRILSWSTVLQTGLLFFIYLRIILIV